MAISDKQIQAALEAAIKGIPKDPREQEKLFQEIFAESRTNEANKDCTNCAGCAICPSWVGTIALAGLKAF